MRRLLPLAALGLLLSFFLAACGTASDTVEPTVTRVDAANAPATYTPTVEGGAPPVASPAPGGGADLPTTVELDLQDILFVPADFSIPANTDVTVTLKNTGALPHNFSIPDQDISQDVAAGATETITLNLPAGTYDFDCDEPGHKEAGMVGVLTVVDAGAAAPAASTDSTPATSTDASAGGTTAVELDLQDILFVPADFTIPANTDVTVTMKNTGALPHNFSIPDQNISHDVAAGATETMTLNLPAGTYNFDCDEPGHKEAGMVGVLTVK